MAEQKRIHPRDGIRKSLTEVQERVVDRMLSGESYLEASEHEGIPQKERDAWNRLGTAFEEIVRERLAGRWESCRMMTLLLLRESQKRLLGIITKGTDADAIKASAMVLEMKASLVPNGFRFTLTQEQREEWSMNRRDLGDYWEGIGHMPTTQEILSRPYPSPRRKQWISSASGKDTARCEQN